MVETIEMVTVAGTLAFAVGIGFLCKPAMLPSSVIAELVRMRRSCPKVCNGNHRMVNPLQK